MVVPFFEDELVLLHECSNGDLECSCKNMMEELAKRIDDDESDDLTNTNVYFRLIGKLSFIEKNDVESLLKRAKMTYDLASKPQLKDGEEPCRFGDYQCRTCEFKRDCDVKIDDFRDIDFNEAICIFCT